ncbi:MAG: carboxypeptidase-like regulatory domain-containing protein [Crocinitomicaceae bacterium]|nr:carboxypeptidase-like regulatory domain-containing protein [Crocinitomicaceae bacterium]
MKKGMYIAVILVFGVFTFSLGQSTAGEIKGKVWQADSSNTAIGAHVYVEVAGSKKGVVTDFDGNFRISSIPVGEYTLTATQATGKRIFTNVKVMPDQITNVGSFALQDSMLTVVVVSAFREKLIAEEPAKINISIEDIRVSPNKFDPIKIVATAGGTQLTGDGKGVIIRGSRPESTLYYIDGVKSNSMAAIPGAAIGHISVYTGGVPAKYGDCTGGVVVMETVSYFDLYNRWKASQMK